ncbi:hypothetical protein [Aporhodopirellula aestuarii]|uniref:Uncharacterized protein n=1 Tax=Aporhodopirellula aestuarii TaxID=2950107 RepID=A0ABT0U0F8_9BACT|nr:hypothetical protein [Aporhodopirellula aestuarii]MCM2370342.1 hypothetical protein [Aporhodopirellula aestuarii]
MDLIRFGTLHDLASRIARCATLLAAVACSAQSHAPAHAQQPNTADADTTEAADERSSNDNLLRRMTTAGIQLTDDKSFTLPEPTFVSIDGEAADRATALKALEKISGRYGIAGFTRNSVVAPISVQTDSIKNDAGDRIGHFIDVAFVVHQSIAEIRKSEALDDFKSDPDAPEKTIEYTDQDNPDELEKNKTRSLTKQELAQYGVTLDGNYEALGYLQMPLLSKVIVRGVARARRSVWPTDDENAPIILTWLLDSRFGSPSPDPESISNQWRAIERDSVGEKVLGPPRPYAGMGGYVAISPVPDKETASIIQLRFVIHEPYDWFDGRNLLRSKLPILIQDRVRNLRRELKD